MSANTELKITSDSGSTFTVGGYGVVFGGQDLSDDRFTAKTDFWLDKISQTPMVLYQHGQDHRLERAVVGRVVSTKVDELGLWVEAQISTAKKYADAIRKLVASGVLGWSSGSVPHLVERVQSKTRGVTEITSWPIVELSLTPTPAEPRTVGIKELKSLAASDPLLLPIARQAEQAIKEAKVAVSDLPDSSFAFIAPGTLDDEQKTFPRANRRYPHHDEHGDLDPDELKSALADAVDADQHVEAMAHLMRHEHAAATGGRDDAHEQQWSDGTAPKLLVIAAKAAALAECIAADRVAMERLHMDTKSGGRINAAVRAQLKTLHADLGYLLENANDIELGEDGTAQLDLYRAAFEFMTLEEVA